MSGQVQVVGYAELTIGLPAHQWLATGANSRRVACMILPESLLIVVLALLGLVTYTVLSSLRRSGH